LTGELSAGTWVILGAWQMIWQDVDLQVCSRSLCFGVELIQKLKPKPF